MIFLNGNDIIYYEIYNYVLSVKAKYKAQSMIRSQQFAFFSTCLLAPFTSTFEQNFNL